MALVRDPERDWKAPNFRVFHFHFSLFKEPFCYFDHFLVDSLIACALKTTVSGKIWHSVIFSKKYYPIVTEPNLRLCRFFEKIFPIVSKPNLRLSEISTFFSNFNFSILVQFWSNFGPGGRVHNIIAVGRRVLSLTALLGGHQGTPP